MSKKQEAMSGTARKYKVRNQAMEPISRSEKFSLTDGNIIIPFVYDKMIVKDSNYQLIKAILGGAFGDYDMEEALSKGYCNAHVTIHSLTHIHNFHGEHFFHGAIRFPGEPQLVKTLVKAYNGDHGSPLGAFVYNKIHNFFFEVMPKKVISLRGLNIRTNKKDECEITVDMRFMFHATLLKPDRALTEKVIKALNQAFDAGIYRP